MSIELWLLGGGNIFDYLKQDDVMVRNVFERVRKHLARRAMEKKLGG